MEWMIIAAVALVALVGTAVVLLVRRDRRNRSLGEHHGEHGGDPRHADALARAYGADHARDSFGSP